MSLNFNECKLMLQRSHLQDKKQKQKKIYDNVMKIFQGKLESDIKAANKKADIDFIDLKDIEPNKAKVEFSQNFKEIVVINLFKSIEEACKIHNEYAAVKN